jgi:hypothetical protein
MENGSDNQNEEVKPSLKDPMELRNTDTGSMRKAEEVNGKIVLNADNRGMAVPSAGKTQALPGISDPMAMRNTDTGNLRKMAEDTTTRKTIKLKPIRPRGTQPGSLKPILPGTIQDSAKPSSPTVRVAASDVASAVSAAQISDLPENKDGVQTVSISRIKSKKTAKLSPLPSVAKAKSVPSKNTIKLRPSTATATSRPIEGEAGAPGEKKTATIKITALPGKKKNASKKTIKLTPSTTPKPDPGADAAAAASAPTVGLTPPARDEKAPIDLSDAGTVVLQEPPATDDTKTQAIKSEQPPVEAKPDVAAAGSINIVPPPAAEEGDSETKTQAIRVKPPQQAKPDIGAAGSINIVPPAPGEPSEETPVNALAPTIVAGMDSPVPPTEEGESKGVSALAPTIVAGMDSPVPPTEEEGMKAGSPGGLSIGAPPPPPPAASPGGLGGLQIQQQDEVEGEPPLAHGETPGKLKKAKVETGKPSAIYTLAALIILGLLIFSAFVQAAQYVNTWEQARIGQKIDIPMLGDLVK